MRYSSCPSCYVFGMSVLVCVDHSPESLRAAESAARSGLLDRKTVYLMHVCEGADKVSADIDLLKQIERIFESYAAPDEVKALFAFGNPVDAILEKAYSLEVGLIVVGAHQRSTLGRIVLGSVSQSLIAKSKVPVLVARKSEFTGSGKILVALDDSPASSSSLQWLGDESWAINKDIVLISIVERLASSFFSESDVAKAAEQLARHDWNESLRANLLGKWSKLLAADLGREVVPCGVVDGSPEDQIVKASLHWGPEIVVLGSNAKLRSDRVLLGSVSQAIATKIPNAVLVVPCMGANPFETMRQDLHSCDELGLVLSEKPHPAKTYTPITGTDTNGFMPFW